LPPRDVAGPDDLSCVRIVKITDLFLGVRSVLTKRSPPSVFASDIEPPFATPTMLCPPFIGIGVCFFFLLSRASDPSPFSLVPAGDFSYSTYSSRLRFSLFHRIVNFLPDPRSFLLTSAPFLSLRPCSEFQIISPERADSHFASDPTSDDPLSEIMSPHPEVLGIFVVWPIPPPPFLTSVTHHFV